MSFPSRTGRKLNIRRLKAFAYKNLLGHPKLRSLLLQEKDEMSVEEFLAKMDLWLKLLDVGEK